MKLDQISAHLPIRFSMFSHEPTQLSPIVYMKLENMQNMNSFKLRGIANQFECRQAGKESLKPLVTMSAGKMSPISTDRYLFRR